MDELLQLLINFMEQIEGNFDQLDDAEAQEISEFLIETMAFMMEQQAQPPRTSDVQSEMPQGADLLWILSNGDTNAFVNYLRTYPGEGLRELAANPVQLANVIARFQEQNPGQEPSVGADGIPNTQFPSSNVAGMKYDPRSGKLLVKFHGENKEPVYQYDGVPPQIFQILQHGNAFAKTKGKNKFGEWWPMKNPSIGASVNQYLKAGGYAYQRLN
jgi:hypothetical protein